MAGENSIPSGKGAEASPLPVPVDSHTESVENDSQRDESSPSKSVAEREREGESEKDVDVKGETETDKEREREGEGEEERESDVDTLGALEVAIGPVSPTSGVRQLRFPASAVMRLEEMIGGAVCAAPWWKRWWKIIATVLLLSLSLLFLGLYVWTSFDFTAWLVIVSLISAIVLLVWDKPPDRVLLGLLSIYLLFDAINPEQALSGFASPAVFSIAMLLIIAAALEHTGGLDLVARWMFRHFPEGDRTALLVFLVPVSLISAVMNNTPVVAMLIPIVQRYGPRVGLHPFTTLMPLSFSTILGGTCSMIGTSTNLVVDGLVKESDPNTTLSFFDVGLVGFPLLLVGLVYMTLTAGKLLPDRGTPAERYLRNPREYCVGALVTASSPLAGHSLSRLRQRDRLPLSLHLFRIIRRDGERVAAPTPQTMIEEGDCLYFSGGVENVQELYKMPGLIPLTSADLEFNAPYADFGTGTTDTGNNSETEDLESGSERRGNNARSRRSGSGSQTSAINKDGDESSGTDGIIPGSSQNLLRPRSQTIGSGVEDVGVGRRVAAARRIGGVEERADTRISLDAHHLSSSPSLFRLHQNTSNTILLIEAVVASHSPFCGKQVGEINFQARYPLVAIVAVHRQGAPLHTPIASTTLRAGDLILLESRTRGFLDRYGGDFALVTVVAGGEEGGLAGVAVWRQALSVAVLLAVVILNSLDVFDLSAISLAGVILLLLTECITPERAWRSLSGPFLVTLSAAFGIATALEASGVASELGRNIVSVFSGLGEGIGILVGVYISTAIMSAFITNAAAVAVMFPVAREAVVGLSTATNTAGNDGAETSTADPALLKAVYVILMLAASSAFSTPIGYQTNLMVAGPGGYRFRDFLRFGGPLQLIAAVVSVTLAYYVY